ncbi:MAG TPA: MFS transporter [Steroidobacteraceae bacterium]
MAAVVIAAMPFKVRAWSAWGVAVLFALYLFGFQTGYSAVNSSIQKDIGLTVAQLGAVAAAYTWSFAIFQLFGGALLDRLGARRVLLPAIAIFTVGVFFFATARSFQAIVAAQLVLALGACVGFVGAGYMGGQWFGMAKFSFMFGLVQCLASLFSAFNQNLMASAVQALDWRELYFRVGAVGIAVLAVAMVFLRDPASVAPSRIERRISQLPRELGSSILQIARIPHVWFAAGFGALTFGALLSAGVVWAPKLMLARGLSPDSASLAASMLWLGLALGCIVVPWWSDAVGRRKLPSAVGIAIQLLALATLVHLPLRGDAVTMALWLAFGFGAAAHMLAFSAAADVVRMELIGTSAAIVNGAMFLVSGLLIARPGQLAEDLAADATAVSNIAVRAAFPLELALLAALALALLIRESYPRA